MGAGYMQGISAGVRSNASFTGFTTPPKCTGSHDEDFREFTGYTSPYRNIQPHKTQCNNWQVKAVAFGVKCDETLKAAPTHYTLSSMPVLGCVASPCLVAVMKKQFIPETLQGRSTRHYPSHFLKVKCCRCACKIDKSNPNDSTAALELKYFWFRHYYGQRRC